MKRILYVFMTIMSLLLVVGCGADNKQANVQKQDDSIRIVDVTGREVSINKTPERVIVIGHGGLKFYAYVCGDDKLIGVEDVEKRGHTVKGQAFHYAYPKIKTLDTIGKGGPKIVPDYEQIAYKKPDVIFASYIPKDELDEIQKRLNIPVIGIGESLKGDIFNENAYKSFEIIGKVMNRVDRAKKLTDFLKAAKEDLQKRVGEKISGPRVYMGGASFRGEQGILSTKSSGDLLDIIKINNVMAQETKERSLIIDKEKLLQLNPEVILVDLSGKNKVLEERSSDPAFFEALQAVQQDRIYAIMPYFTYGMNYDTAILDMYYIGKVIYPEKFADIDIETKASEIYTLFNGMNAYPDLMKIYPESFKVFK